MIVEKTSDEEMVLFIGDSVDVLDDSTSMWRLAKIVDIYLANKEREETAVLIRYQDTGVQEIVTDADKISAIDDAKQHLPVNLIPDTTSPQDEHVYTVDEYVDVLDKFVDKSGIQREKWRVCRILEVKQSSIFIHYEDWSDYYDEWINVHVDANRVRPAFQMTGIALYTSEEDVSILSMQIFTEKMKAINLSVVEQAMDGNCLFRSVALQIYGNHELYHRVRMEVVKYMMENEVRHTRALEH